MPELDDAIRKRPESLTLDRAELFLPELQVSKDWQRRDEAGKLPEGILGVFGMFERVWHDSVPTQDEAEWILSLLEFGSWRWMTSIVLHGDDNQIHGMHLKEVSEKVLEGG